MLAKLQALLRMAARNVVRNRRRTALSAAAIGLAVAFVWLTVALTVGMLERAVRDATDGFLGHVQIHRSGYVQDPTLSRSLPDALVETLEREEPGLAVAPRVYAQGYASAGTVGSGVLLVGVDPAREAACSGLDDDVLAGGYLGTNAGEEALLGDDLAARLGVSVGDHVTLTTSTVSGAPGTATLEVVGTISTGIVEYDDAAVFTSLGEAQALTGIGRQVHELSLRGADASAAAELAQRVRAPVEAVASEAEVQTWRQVAPDLAVFVDVAAGTFAGFALVLVLVVGAAILLSQSMTVFERRVELGLLRAIGLRPRQLLVLLVIESSMVAGIGALIGLGLGGLALAVMLRTGFDLGGGAELEMSGVSISPVVYPSVDLATPIEALVVTVLLAAMASLLAGARTALRGPVGVIRDA